MPMSRAPVETESFPDEALAKSGASFASGLLGAPATSRALRDTIGPSTNGVCLSASSLWSPDATLVQAGSGVARLAVWITLPMNR